MGSRTLALVLITVAACGGGGSDSTLAPTTPLPPPPAPTTDATVRVRNNFFDPAVVSVSAGGTVTWTWEGQDHSVTSVLAPLFSPSSPVRDAPATHGPLTFNTAGTFQYICTVHGAVVSGQTTGMRGQVVVVP